MRAETFRFPASDGAEIFCYRWRPDGPPRALVQIAHGMGEHAGRYAPVAERLTGRGYAVVADDHRGHGETAGPEHLGDFGPGGWDRVILDVKELGDQLAREHPGVPRVLLGHSMGAMLAQQYLGRHGDGLDAAVISGSPGLRGPVRLFITIAIARFERWRRGPRAESPVLQALLFGKANEPFAGPEATGFEWLSRDPAQVELYVDDPYCGFVLRTGSLVSLFQGAKEARRREHIARIPKELPIYVFSGTADPVHGELSGLERLLARYREAGLDRVEHRFYEGGRHEMLNETNRDEVVEDLAAWLDARFPAS